MSVVFLFVLPAVILIGVTDWQRQVVIANTYTVTVYSMSARISTLQTC